MYKEIIWGPRMIRQVSPEKFKLVKVAKEGLAPSPSPDNESVHGDSNAEIEYMYIITQIKIWELGEGGLCFGTCAQSQLYLCTNKVICSNRLKIWKELI